MSESILIDLDDSSKEINLIYNTRNLSNPNSYINTGFNHEGIAVNEDRSLLVCKGILYSTYSISDLWQLEAINDAIKHNKKRPKLDLDLLLSIF